MGKCQYCGRLSGRYELCITCKNLQKDGKIQKCHECGDFIAAGDRCEHVQRNTLCDICGSNWARSDVDLCNAHYKMMNYGKLAQCERCGTWHFKNAECPCCTVHYEEDELSQPKKACVLCGKRSFKVICGSCSQKYQQKEVFLKLTNAQNFELLGAEYQGHYTCKDGHIVKSKSERDIDNYFFDHNIRHVYEKELRTDNGISIHPDFYLPDQDAYLEHWGYDESHVEYTEIKNKKMEYYRSHGITLICTYENSDAKDIESALEYKLGHFQKECINFEETHAQSGAARAFSYSNDETRSDEYKNASSAKNVEDSQAHSSNAMKTFRCDANDRLTAPKPSNENNDEPNNDKFGTHFTIGMIAIIFIIAIIGLLSQK